MGKPPLVVVMGISGVGKSAVGHELADRFSLDYADGDDFHSEANIAKMSAGTPLTDEDRWPWLADIGVWLHEHVAAGGVISCSALKRAYRDVLVDAAPRTYFLHLTGDHDLIDRAWSTATTSCPPCCWSRRRDARAAAGRRARLGLRHHPVTAES